MSSEKMPFTLHLTELRKRIIVSAIAIFAGFIVSFAFSENIFKVLTFPMNSTLTFRTEFPYLKLLSRENVNSLVFLGPAEAFWAHMKIAMITGFIASVPVLFYEFWRFISPGLLEGERKMALPFIAVTSGLFLLGSLFCFAIVLPFAMNFLLTYKTQSLTPMLSVGRYIDFCLKFILAFGIVFELPVVMVFLSRFGIISPQAFARNRKYAVLLAFVAAAILTPTPDAFNQVLMAVPIIILYEAGLIFSRIFARRADADDKGKEPQGDSL